jgi:hypothetical protein
VNALNIHIVNDGMPWGGLHRRIWYPLMLSFEAALFVVKSAVSGSTPAHEVGHYFTLDHTHEDWDAKSDFKDCYKEPIKRDRRWALLNECGGGEGNLMCNSTGDALCDTPADPKLNEQGRLRNCNFDDANLRDNYGDSYLNPPAGSSQPDVKNIMSYSPCDRNIFSRGQVGVMVSGMIHRYSNRSDDWSNRNQRVDDFEPDNKPRTARNIAFHQKQIHTFHSQEANLGRSCDIDHVSFQVPVQGRYIIRTQEVAGRAKADTYLRVYSYNTVTKTIGSLRAENDNADANTVFSEVEVILPAGTYVVEISNSQLLNLATPTNVYYSIEVLPCVDTQNMVINAAPVFCADFNSNHWLSVSPANAIDYLWSVSPANAFFNQISNGQPSINVLLNPAAFVNPNQTLTVSVVPVYACGAGAPITKVIKVGKPTTISYSKKPTIICARNEETFLAIRHQLGETYTVTNTHSDLSMVYDAANEQWIFSSDVVGYYPIEVKATNSCGTYTEIVSILVRECVQACGAKMFPNPATDYAQITLHEAMKLTNFSVQFFNSMGQNMNVTYTKTESQGMITAITLTTNNLPQGIYYVLVNGETVTTNNAPPKVCRFSGKLLVTKEEIAR